MTEPQKAGTERFGVFIKEWNAHERRATPELHFKMAGWLEEQWNLKKVKLLLMAFRGGGKSTIAALFAAWLLYINPDLRILILAADQRLAGKMAQQIRKIIERHPLTNFLKPDKKEQWAGNRFTVKRNSALRDPSVQASGINMNVTGSHADVIICDDVEVPKTSSTKAQREALRERLGEIEFIIGPGGTQLYIGTPHTWYSLYADRPRTEEGEEKPFLQGFDKLEIPVVDAEGKSAWKERYPPEEIERIRARSGPNKFASQMMLEPLSVNNGRLDPDLIKIYAEDFEYVKQLDAVYVAGKRMSGVSVWWDPAFGSPRGDKSVVAVVFLDDAGNYYLQHIEYLRTCEGIAEDRATAQCRRVAEIAKKFHLPSITVEDNGIGKFMPGWLRTEIGRINIFCGVVEKSSRENKDKRITGALDAPLNDGKIWLYKGMVDTAFMTEMKEWRPFARAHDDGLDALAGAIAQAPLKIHRVYGANRPRPAWMENGKSYRAKADFEA